MTYSVKFSDPTLEKLFQLHVDCAMESIDPDDNAAYGAAILWNAMVYIQKGLTWYYYHIYSKNSYPISLRVQE